MRRHISRGADSQSAAPGLIPALARVEVCAALCILALACCLFAAAAGAESRDAS